jgi:septal ring factor EnvC (AmiA/AmiB activator)
MNDHIPDVTKMISDTPITDAANTYIRTRRDFTITDHQVWQEHGEHLERELNAANAEIEEKRKDIVYIATEKAKLENRIKRLEEAGDAMVSHAKALGMDGTGLVKRWNKAKEAKL